MKLNSGFKTTSVARMYAHPAAATNMSGNLGFKATPKIELVNRVATCFWNEPKFYGTISDQSKEILELMERVSEADPEFCFKLAAYARNVLNLRTVSVVLFVVASNSKKAKTVALARKYAPSVIIRADEIAEALAFQFQYKGSKSAMPNNLRRALSDSCNRFGAYAFSKYNRDGAVKLKDAIKILHPKPKNKEQSKLYKSILDDTLKPADTWEVTLSNWKGKGFESKKDAWNSIQGKMGAFAILRNLRNMLDENCNMAPVVEKLTDKKTILNSRLLPFRFYSAYLMLGENSNPFTGSVLSALSKAMDYSVDNVPDLPGVTVIAIDHSGSMHGANISTKSIVTNWMAADCLAAIARAKSRLCVVMEYADEAKFINVADSGVMATLKEIQAKSSNGVTNCEDVFTKLMDKKVRADRIIVISDNQDNSGYACRGWDQYKRMFPGAKLYSVNLGGYETSQFVPEKGTAYLAGFSEKIFQFISLAEQGPDAMVREIEKYDIEKIKTKGKEPEEKEDE